MEKHKRSVYKKPEQTERPSMESNHSQLTGKWASEDNAIEKTTLEFKPDGEFEYTICGEHKDQKIFLTYRVEKDALITVQPLCSREERTLFKFTEDGKLAFLHGGDQMTVYVRWAD